MDTQASLQLLFRAGLRKEFRDNYAKYAPQYPGFLKVSSTNQPEMAASLIAGPSRLRELYDGEQVTYMPLVMGPKVAGVDKEFGGGMEVTPRTVEDDQYGKAKQGMKHLANAVKNTYEYRAASFLDDAFTGSTFKGYDGKAWCATDHTYINQTGSWANTPSTQTAFSVAGVMQVQDLFMQLKDHNGDPIVMWPNTLVIGNSSGDWNKAYEIFKSQKAPFTANNQDNALKARFSGLGEPIVSVYKSSAKSYFMIDQQYNDAHFVMRRPAKYEENTEFGNGAFQTKVTTRFLIWGVDPRGWVGVNPA